MELWDHKGPGIFFINCIGWMLTGGKIGVFAIQILSMGIFLIYTFRSLRLFFNNLYSILLTFVTILWMTCSYYGGNLVDEYMLPFYSVSFYLTLRWLKQTETGEWKHDKWYAFYQGILLSFAFLTRLTNAIPSCCIIGIIFLVLISRKEFANLRQNILYYCLGFIALSAPFFWYFHIHDALNEMVYATFTYNVAYALNSGEAAAASGTGSVLIKHLLLASGCYGVAGLTILQMLLERKIRLWSIVWLMAAAFLCLWLPKGIPAAYYRLLTIPFIPIVFINLKLIFEKKSKIILVASAALFAIVPIFKLINLVNDYEYDFIAYDSSALAKSIHELIPEEDAGAFIAYDCKPDIYLHLNLLPCYKWFTFQNWHKSHTEKVRSGIIDSFSTCKAKWILVNSIDFPEIERIVADNYSVHSKLTRIIEEPMQRWETYTLYRRNFSIEHDEK